MARPKSEKPRVYVLQIRLTAEERSAITAMARGMAVGEWARAKLLSNRMDIRSTPVLAGQGSSVKNISTPTNEFTSCEEVPPAFKGEIAQDYQERLFRWSLQATSRAEQDERAKKSDIAVSAFRKRKT